MIMMIAVDHIMHTQLHTQDQVWGNYFYKVPACNWRAFKLTILKPIF